MPKGRKKKKRRGGAPDSPKKGFDYRPFAGVELPPSGEAGGESGEARGEPEPANAEEPGPPADDGTLEEMMLGVVPMDADKKLADRKAAVRPMKAEMDDSELVMRHLDELVHGVAPFEMSDTEEYVEAAVKGLDRRIVKKLRRGEYSIQAHLDLHGYRKDEARLEVARFIEESVSKDLRCVLVVHGRGLGSKDNIPVLKEKLTAWLTRGAIGRHVLAFTSARPFDGGTGAVYVLLRR